MTQNESPNNKFDIIYKKCFLIEHIPNSGVSSLYRYFWCRPIATSPTIPEDLNELKPNESVTRMTQCEFVFMGNNSGLPKLPSKIIEEIENWITQHKELRISIYPTI